MTSVIVINNKKKERPVISSAASLHLIRFLSYRLIAKSLLFRIVSVLLAVESRGLRNTPTTWHASKCGIHGDRIYRLNFGPVVSAGSQHFKKRQGGNWKCCNRYAENVNVQVRHREIDIAANGVRCKLYWVWLGSQIIARVRLK